MPSNCEYYLYQRYIKYGNSEYVPVYPPEYAISGDSNQPPVVKRCDSPNCGFWEPQYRWHQEDISEAYICSGGNKYYKEVYQVSYDNGFNWENVVPEQTRQGSIYEYDSEDCQHDYSKDYLTFIPISGSSTFKFSGNSVNYSLDSGATWTSLASNTYSPTVSAGSKIMWKASGLTPTSGKGIGIFSSTGNFTVEGNAMSLVSGDNFTTATTITSHQFRYLFSGCTGLTSAENLVLPATTLEEYCYSEMFAGCTSLTTAPELPATTLGYNCYFDMFYGCTSLTTAPELPATTLVQYCYYHMFHNCTSLTIAPELPATTLENGCYDTMFWGCTSLTTAPSVLPATTLASNCYANMFDGCTSLTTAPSILPATTLELSCYSYMFRDCTSLTTAPELPATTLAQYCYSNMFRDCTSLNNITCLATDISASNCTTNWVSGVANSGTFTKASTMTSWATGNNGIPNNWTVVNA